MKIAIASSGLGHVYRGIEAWAADLAHALDTRGHDVLLFKGAGEQSACYERTLGCIRRDSPLSKRLLGWLPRRGLWRLGLGSPYTLEQTTFAARLIPQLRRERVDILHVQDPHVAVIAEKARRLGLIRARTILAHGTEEPSEFLRKLSHVQHLAPWHLEQTPTSPKQGRNWTAIPNFIDTQLFHPGRSEQTRQELGIPPHAVVALCSAAIKRTHKRIDYLLDSVAQLLQRRPDLPLWLLVVGGQEPDTASLVDEGQKLLGDRVRFLVSCPRERMPDIYRAADLFVLCSLKEMGPVALLEATASGLACILHQHPVMQWMLGPGGRSIDMSASEPFIQALEELAGDTPLRRQLGEEARQHCVATFGRDNVVDRIVEYYRHVLREPKAATRQPRQLLAEVTP